jgi:uncharacterized protein (TIGR03546 family)
MAPMLAFLIRPLRMGVQALLASDSSRQIAWGFALGMLVGLVPKGNLIALMLGVLLFALRVNLSAGLMSAGVFSFVGLALDSFAHRIGAMLLTWPAARPLFAAIYQLPLGPYCGINNTVVVGQLLIGIYCLYPAYRLGLTIAERYRPPLVRWLSRYKVVRWLRGAEVGVGWGSGS